jgi:hypothetical protein
MGNLQVRFLEGWAPAMAPGHSTLGITSGLLVIRPELIAKAADELTNDDSGSGEKQNCGYCTRIAAESSFKATLRTFMPCC